MARKQINFDAEADVLSWIQSIAPGLRKVAINNACRLAMASGKQWVMDLAFTKAYGNEQMLGNDEIASNEEKQRNQIITNQGS